MRIGQKLTWGFAGIASLVVIVGYICVYASQEALQKSIGESSVMLAQETLDKIDRNIYNQIERWKSYCVTNPRLKETTLLSNQEFEKLDNLQEYINEKDQEWISVPKEATTPFMEELINNRLARGLRNRTDFYERNHGYKVIGELFITNKYGANVAQTGKTTDYYQADEQWWQKAKQDGIYVANVEYDRSADVYSTDIGIRIDDESGNFLGVMKVVLNIEEMTNIIETLKKSTKYETLEFHLINREGKVLYSLQETHQHKILEDISREEFFKRIRSDTGYFIAKEDRPGTVKRFFAYAHSKGHRDFKGLGWILTVDFSTKEIFAPVITLRNVLLSISLILTILAVIIGFSISRSISKPLSKLRSAINEISEGNLDYKVGTDAKDEIGQLSRAFDEMTDDLKKSTTSIENLNQEITERKKAEEALRQSEERFRSLVEATSDWVWEVDQNGIYTYSSPKVKELLGYEPGEIIGKLPFDLMPTDEAERVGTIFQDIVASQKPIERLENVNLHKDGRLIELETSGVPIFDDSGGFVGYRGIDRDITERKRAEAERKKVMEEMERMNRLMNGREKRVIEMKREVNALLAELGRQPQYKSVLEDETVVSSDKAE